MSPSRRFLVAIDEGSRSLNICRYLAAAVKQGEAKATVLHLYSSLPTGLAEMANDPMMRQRLRGARAWEDRQIRDAEDCLERAVKAMIAAGLPAERIKGIVREKDKGVSAGVLAEARQGYEGVVIGRRVRALRGMPLGGSASKIADALTGLPLWVVGKGAHPHAFLVGVDGSDNAARAVDYLAPLVAPLAAPVRVVFVLPRAVSRSASDLVKGNMQTHLNRAARVLAAAGVSTQRIATRVVQGDGGRAKCLLAEARAMGNATLVLGRKGLSDSREFTLGGVTRKALNGGRGMALWLVP